MSLVHLSSVGQQPNTFFNSFPQGIQLSAGAEVSLVGYSGNLNGEANQTTGEAYEIVIQEGQNDTMTFMHGDTRAASIPASSGFVIIDSSAKWSGALYHHTLRVEESAHRGCTTSACPLLYAPRF